MLSYDWVVVLVDDKMLGSGYEPSVDKLVHKPHTAQGPHQKSGRTARQLAACLYN